MRIYRFDSLESTSDYCLSHDDGEDFAVVARSQSAGRGTKGRSFVSDVGGLYVTFVRHFEGYPACDAFRMMTGPCVAVCETLERFGVSPVIRWPNDVLSRGRKICGMLVENTFSGDRLTRSVAGIGINVRNRLPACLSETATSLFAETGSGATEDDVLEALLENVGKEYSPDDYRRRIDWFGRKVMLSFPDGGTLEAEALDVDDRGGLVVRTDGGERCVFSAEVTLRL